MRAGPSQRALFLVHPLGGELLAYRELARAIRSPLRVLGLRWAPRGQESGKSLRALATEHVAQLRLVQPKGPYLLAGWSFGGVLAMEIARQLREAGEEVPMLGLFDANPRIDPTTGRFTAESTLPARLTSVLEQNQQARDSGTVGELPIDKELLALLGSTVPEGVTADHLRDYLIVTRDSLLAATKYEPLPYGGPIDLFQPQQSPIKRQQRLAQALGELATGALRLHLVPGDHYSMLRPPHVAAIGNAMDKVLASINER